MKIVLMCKAGHNDHTYMVLVQDAARAIEIAFQKYAKEYGFSHGRTTVLSVNGKRWRSTPAAKQKELFV